MLHEPKHIIARGQVNLYTGITTGLTYWEVEIELPLDIKPNSIFRETRVVPKLSPPTPLITDFAWAFEKIGQQFMLWARRLEIINDRS